MILVAGITGHTGRYFIEELKRNKYKDRIRCILRNAKDEDILKKSGLNYEIIVGDLSDQQFLNKCCKNVDTILEIYNIHFSMNMLNAALKNKVKRIIVVHTTGIFSKYKMASIEYKTIESNFISKAKDNIEYTILRPTMIYGDMCDHNISKFIRLVDKIRIFPLISGGKAKIQPVTAQDLAKTYYQVLINPKTTKNKEYNISGSKEISFKELFKLISTELNKKTVFISIPIWISLIPVYLIKIITLGKKDYVEKVLRMNETRVFSYKKATDDFDYQPLDFNKSLKREIKQYKGCE